VSRAASRSPRRIAAGMLPALAIALAGCEADRADLQTWMDEARRATPRTVERLSEPKRFEPFRYAAERDEDPFSASRMKVGAVLAGRGGGASQPDLARRREALEAYPLDNLKMVGNLRRGNVTVALLQADSMLFQARVGNYIGQNFGRIVRISEDEVAIKETVQDAAGDWVERDTILQLQAAPQESRK
jgi:type IV pilus assembly protein PilP